MKSRIIEVPCRVRRTKYPYRKIRVVLRTTEHRENKRATSLRKRNDFALRASNLEISCTVIYKEMFRSEEETDDVYGREDQRTFSRSTFSRVKETWHSERDDIGDSCFICYITLAKIKQNAVTLRYLMNTF